MLEAFVSRLPQSHAYSWERTLVNLLVFMGELEKWREGEAMQQMRKKTRDSLVC